MPKNLKEKISHVLQDCEKLPRFELLNRLERVILEEVGFLSSEHTVDYHDLMTIQSRAASIHSARRLDEQALGRIHGDGGLIRTLCLLEASVEYFRGKGMINFTTTFNKK